MTSSKSPKFRMVILLSLIILLLNSLSYELFTFNNNYTYNDLDANKPESLNTAAGADWWNNDWHSRKQILINNSANTQILTNYLMSLNISYCFGMKENFDDLRFIDSNLIELNYWIENLNLGNDAVIWVNISNIPASNITTIYIYYGNVNAGSKSKFLFEFTYNSTLDYTVTDDYWTTRNLWEKPGSNNMYVLATPLGTPSSWYWTGTSWLRDDSAASGFPHHMAYQNRFYYYDEDWGELTFYTKWEGDIYENHIKQWSGSSWVTNSTLETGLNLHNGDSASGGEYLYYIMFTYKNKKHLLLDIDKHKYTWNGNQWIENASIPVPDGMSHSTVHLHYKFTQGGKIKYHWFPVLIEQYNDTHCRIWQLNENDWDIIHVGKIGDFPNSVSGHIPDSNVIDNRLTLSIRHDTYPIWSSNLYFVDHEPTYSIQQEESYNLLSDEIPIFLIVTTTIGGTTLLISALYLFRRKRVLLHRKKNIVSIKGVALSKGDLKVRDSEVLESPPPLVGSKKVVYLSCSELDFKQYDILKIAMRLESFSEIDKVMFQKGDEFTGGAEYMEQKLKDSNIFILFCFSNTIASKEIKDEWQPAFQLRKKGLMKLIPVFENEEEIPVMLLHLPKIRFTKNKVDEFISELYKEIIRNEKSL